MQSVHITVVKQKWEKCIIFLQVIVTHNDKYNIWIHTYLRTELSPSWEATNCAAIQEIPSNFKEPEVHHRVHKSPPLVPILKQFDSVHTIPSYLSKIHFNIVHPLRLGLPSGLFPSGFPTNILYAFLVSPIRATYKNA
jgi:hypothetical protein